MKKCKVPSSMPDIQKALNIQLYLMYQHLAVFCRRCPTSQVLTLAICLRPHPVVPGQYSLRSSLPFQSISTELWLCFINHHCTVRGVGYFLNQNYEHMEAKVCSFLLSPNPFMHSFNPVLSEDYGKHSPTETSKKQLLNKYLLTDTKHWLTGRIIIKEAFYSYV